VHVSRTDPELPVANVDEAGVQHRRVAGYNTPRTLWRLKLLDLAYSLRVRRVLPEADVLVTNTFWLPIVERRRSRGRPYVHVARYPKGQMRLYPERAILQTVSEPIRAAILREVPRAGPRLRVVPYPLAPIYLVPRREAKPVILYAGRLHPEKGVHLLIESFVRLGEREMRGWTLRIIGPWKTAQGGGGAEYHGRLSELARRANGSVEMIGPIFKETELVSHYRDASIFVYPSLAEFGETFGLAVLEAMAAGCAPVVSALACFRDFIHERENGMVFNHRATDPVGELARVLALLANSPAQREQLREAAWTTARRYTLASIAGRMIDDFRNLIETSFAVESSLSECLPDRR